MRVLLIGSGGREHALAWKIAQSKRLEKLFIAPGNGGTQDLGENIDLDVANHAAVIMFCTQNKIDLIVIGPEAPLVAGLADDLRTAEFLVFGPGKEAAQLEGSKSFTKALCDEMNIPTAAYGRFDNAEDALAYVAKTGAPIVIKADGLAAGKGVTVAMELAQANAAIKDCFSGAFGDAGAEVVIEEFLEGEEVSLFAVTDGTHFVTLASAQDHKRAYDNDEGPNTGGMGAYSPAKVLTPELQAQVEREIIAPTIAGMAARGTPFSGVLYAGLMLTKSGPSLIEYNARFGDPECQVLMMRLESDVLDLLEASAKQTLNDIKPKWRPDAAVTVVMAAKGYPGAYEKGTEIKNADGFDGDNVVFHAGTKRQDGKLLAIGGRVLNVTAMAPSFEEARQNAYDMVDKINWPDGFCRRDIGWRAAARGDG